MVDDATTMMIRPGFGARTRASSISARKLVSSGTGLHREVDTADKGLSSQI
jgi:hypothetical protein